MFSHSFISEGVKYNKKLMTNKYVFGNDQTCSAKIYVLFFAKFFFCPHWGVNKNSKVEFVVYEVEFEI